MAKMVNVNREVVDAFYRYKMPLLTAKVEGRGNGIKTVIPNMVDAAKALDRPPAYTTKFMGIELGAQTQMQVEAERYIINGAHEAETFQVLLDKFIKLFVLCPDCGNPETVLRVTSKKQIEQKCKACGYGGTIPLVHRLTTYIVNNPPEGSSGGKKGKGKTKEERKAEKNAKNGGGKAKKGGKRMSEGDADADADAGGDAGYQALGQKGAQVDAAKARLGGQIEAVAAAEDNDGDNDWPSDGDDDAFSEEAVRARTAAIGAGVTSLVQTDDLDLPEGKKLEIFSKYVAARVGAAKFPAKEVIGEAVRLEIKDKGVMVMVELLLSKADDAFAAIKKYQGLFQRFTIESTKSQKYMIGALEVLLTDRPELLAKAARFFKELYDLDILDEEVIIAWGEKSSKKYVTKEQNKAIRDKCAKFVEWLKEADEEESDEDEDSMVFAANPEAVLEADAAAKAAAEPAKEEAAGAEEEEDLDDDDIENM